MCKSAEPRLIAVFSLKLQSGQELHEPGHLPPTCPQRGVREGRAWGVSGLTAKKSSSGKKLQSCHFGERVTARKEEGGAGRGAGRRGVGQQSGCSQHPAQPTSQCGYITALAPEAGGAWGPSSIPVVLSLPSLRGAEPFFGGGGNKLYGSTWLRVSLQVLLSMELDWAASFYWCGLQLPNAIYGEIEDCLQN